MPDGTIAKLPLLEGYESLVPDLVGAGIDWVDGLRREGLARFGELGMPGPRVEAWKYTNLKWIERTEFASGVAVSQPELEALPPGGLEIDAIRLVLVNGRLRPSCSDCDSLPAGVSVIALHNAVVDGLDGLERRISEMACGHDMPMLALNAAYLQDGVVIEIADGVVVEKPIHLIFVSLAKDDPVAFHPRNLITLGAGSAATIYESHVCVGGASYLSNGAASIRLEEEAVLRHRKLQNESAKAYHVSAVAVTLGTRANYENYTLHIGGRLARNEIHATLEGRGANCSLYGAYVGQGQQHIDTTTFVDHAVPECTSREVYKGALDHNARGVFQGKILVRKNAQKTDGHQLNKALLLSEGAEIDAKPELEIYADDVKCSHGATAGELDEEQLFYLRSRGVPEAEARGLLVTAFLEESLEVIREEDCRDTFREIISNWLAERCEQREA
ncbi:MAG: Fe-S cluster assembly protein SufD [Pseudomonadota bacterium]|mgnify:CR=1 FL=1|nr:Fe-S cluster assembly protein SufD [Pseudomonadota bacterium]